MSQGSEFNPYQAPASDARDEPVPLFATNVPLATRGSRLAAAMIDGLVQLMAIVPLQLALGVYDGFPQIKRLGALQTAAWTIAGFAIYCALNGYLLHKSGQTIGKRVLGIRIVNHEDGQQTPLGRILFKRVLPIQVVAAVPVVGGLIALVDALLIFRKEQRCLHDQIAGTDVVQSLR